MTTRSRLIEYLDSNEDICDDCAAVALSLSHRQAAYQANTSLAREGVTHRSSGTCKSCGRFKTVNKSGAGKKNPSEISSKPPDSVERSWYWEGNVQVRLGEWLVERGYIVHSLADTAARTPGKDIVAESSTGRLWVSVKGYPDRSPHTQARHWLREQF